VLGYNPGMEVPGLSMLPSRDGRPKDQCSASVVIQKFVGYFCSRYAPLLTPLSLGEGLGEGTAGAYTPSPSPSPPHTGERGNYWANF